MGRETPRDFAAWIGRERTETDVLTLAKARALAATLGRRPDTLSAGMSLPAGWHWIYFNSSVARGDLGEDGHERHGSFMPPIGLPRRMWAGGRMRSTGALPIGASARRVTTIRSIEHKEGRSGPLVFVTLHHAISVEGRSALDEEQDLVFRAAPPHDPVASPPGASAEGHPARGEPRRAAARDETAAPRASDAEAAWSEAFTADEVTLFRFSALTFNGHRIHYDQPYATQVEGYPGLVVHGPLVALLVLDAGLRHAGAQAATGWSYRYRAVAPLFCGETFLLRGHGPATVAAGATRLDAFHAGRGTATEAELEVSRAG